MSKDSPKLHFAQIDCKNYGAVFSFDGAGSNSQLGNGDNIRILHAAEAEYIAGLRKLQEDIRVKFESRLKPETKKNILSYGEALDLFDTLNETNPINSDKICYT